MTRTIQWMLSDNDYSEKGYNAEETLDERASR